MPGLPNTSPETTAIDFDRMVEESRVPTIVLDQEMRLAYANPVFMELVQVDWTQIRGAYLLEAFPRQAERRLFLEEHIRKVLAGEPIRFDGLPHKVTMPDGTIDVRIWQCVGEPYRNPQGEVTHAVLRAEDISERVALKRQNDIISDELDHRVKNLFAVIMATARISGSMAQSTEGFVKDFNQRLTSMSRVYSRLSNNDWQGLTLRSLLEEELEVIASPESGAYSLTGDDITLNTKATKDAALIIHELATNAVKYGCFKHTGGRLDVTWGVKDDVLDVTWEESGASGIKPVDREGFGTVLFQMMPNVKVDRQYRDEGILVNVKVPLPISADRSTFP